MDWLLLLSSVLILVVVAGRAHSRYLDDLEADPERQLLLGISFEQPAAPTQYRDRSPLKSDSKLSCD